MHQIHVLITDNYLMCIYINQSAFPPLCCQGYLRVWGWLIAIDPFAAMVTMEYEADWLLLTYYKFLNFSASQYNYSR